MKRLLLEVGAEEIPAGYIDPALKAMAANLLQKLDNARIDYGAVKTYGTPRRLAVEVADVAEKQKSLSTDVLGPPVKVGFDEAGNPTVAAHKFAEKVGVNVKRLKVRQTDKGSYLSAKVSERGLATGTLLKSILPEVILATPFPKSMRWADLAITFARPIHSIVALFGDKAVPFTIEILKSGRYTYGHYFMAPKKIKLTDANSYVAQLGEAQVLVDIEARRQAVVEEINQAAREAGGRILPDEELVDIVTNLVEYPFATVGRFDEEFLAVPDEILITAMREHQKYFAVIDANDKLMPCFVAVNNTRTKDMDLVATGHGRVIRARLADAQFFYRSDVGASFDPWLEKLHGVLFQAKLGSMHAKVLRVQQLAEVVATSVIEQKQSDAALKAHASRAALLCKADLVSQVVVEFPKLQGVMGRVYAGVAGEPAEVATAIEEHYRPTRSGGTLPQTACGSIVSIADKIDSICGCFSVDLKPTGASDPYALRRQGIGIVQIMLAQNFSLSLRALIAKSLSLFATQRTFAAADVTEEVYTFLKNRIAHLLAEEGFSKDVISAVVEVSVDHIPHTWSRVRALEALKARPDFESLGIGFKRVVNIIKKAGYAVAGETTATVETSLFQHDSEGALYKAYQTVEAKVTDKLKQGQFEQALLDIASLKDTVDAFFDDVMVMTDDLQVRDNRLALLGRIAAMFSQLADFSRLAT